MYVITICMYILLREKVQIYENTFAKIFMFFNVPNI